MENLNDKKLNKSITEIRKIKMTSDEKNNMLGKILNYSESPKIQKSVKSPWGDYSFFAKIYKNHFAYYLLIFILSVSTGGGIVFASQTSLPGDVLHPIKVNIIEPIHGVFVLSLEDKAQYESKLATKRLIEAETLASQGNLDENKEKKLNTLLTNHSASLNKTLNKINERELSDSKDESINNIINDFHAEMDAHAQVLDYLENKQSLKNKSEDIMQNLKISETARISADYLKDSLKKEEKEKNKSYEKKKEYIKKIIETTSSDIENLKKDNREEISEDKEIIIRDANEKLDQAKQFLEEVDRNEEEGDSEEIHSILFDSESSAKEAGIFLEAGLRWEEEDDDSRD